MKLKHFGYWKFDIQYWKLKNSITNNQFRISNNRNMENIIQGQRMSPPLDFENRYSFKRRIIS